MVFARRSGTRSTTRLLRWKSWKGARGRDAKHRWPSCTCRTSPDRLVELHGTNLLVECQSCNCRSDPQSHFEFFRVKRKPPLCDCGGFLKPATISFGQSLDPQVMERAQKAALEADLVIALGSTLSVYPAASFPLLAAERAECRTSSSIVGRRTTTMSRPFRSGSRATWPGHFPKPSRP
jgi:NAD-dependent SIR2 family protein deacetylase